MPGLLSTKKLSQNQKELALNAGFSVMEYNAIKIDPIPLRLNSSNIENAIITSQNTVKILMQNDVSIQNCLCVGEKTRALLEKHGVNVLETTDYGKDLAKIIVSKYSDRSFTFFCGNRRRDELPDILTKNEIEFREIQVYKTVLNFKEFKQTFDGVLFFSPSAVQSYIKLNSLENTVAFCIGETTAKEAKKHTSAIEIAANPGIENVIVRAAKYFKTLNTIK